MWIIKWLFIAIIMLAILGFALQNQEQRVAIRIITESTPELPLYFFIYFAFGIGFILGLIVPLVNIWQLKTNLHRTEKASNKTREELNRLRNADIEEEKTEVNALPAPSEPQIPEKSE